MALREGLKKNISGKKNLKTVQNGLKHEKKNNTKFLPNYDHPPPHTYTHSGQIMGFRGLQDGCQWKCSNSAKIWAWNFWYHTQCVSGRLDHKTDLKKNCWKKLIIFHGRGAGGGYPSMENSMEIIFFFKTFPNLVMLIWVKTESVLVPQRVNVRMNMWFATKHRFH